MVKQFTIGDYREIKKVRDEYEKTKGDATVENKMSVAEKLALGYVAKAALYSQQKQQSIRFSTSVQARLEILYEKYPMFTKQYLLSYLLDTALESFGE